MTLFQTSATDEITQVYDKMAREIEQKLRSLVVPIMHPQVAALHNLLESVLVARNSREIVAALVLLQKAVEGLLEGFTSMSAADQQMMVLYRDCHLSVLKGLQDHRAYGPQWTNKQVTRSVCSVFTGTEVLNSSTIRSLREVSLKHTQCDDPGMTCVSL